MDSSRSGLFSTLIMTLPLIVVPAIALLRPPGQMNGVSTAPLDAAESDEDEDFLSSTLNNLSSDFGDSEKSGDKSGRNAEDADVSLFLDEELSDGSNTDPVFRRSSGSGPAKSQPMDSDPFMTDTGGESGRAIPEATPSDPPETVSGAAVKIVEQLNSQGALRTMWFDAGAKSPVGFAAFFRGQTELMRIRFEAVGQNREECARSVLNQVTRWQADQDARR